MVNRGVNAGRAYVDLTVNGDSVNEGIVNAVDDSNGDMARAGQEGADNYGEAYQSTLDRRMEGLRRALADATNEDASDNGTTAGGITGRAWGDALVERIAPVLRETFDGFEQSSEDSGRSAGTRAAVSFGEGFGEGGDSSGGVTQSLADVWTRAVESGRDAGDDSGFEFSEGLRRSAPLAVDDWDTVFAPSDDSADRAGASSGSRFSDALLTRFRAVREGLESQANDFVAGLQMSAGEAGDEAGESFGDRMSRRIGALADSISSDLGDGIEEHGDDIRRGTDNALSDDYARGLGDRMGEHISEGLGDRIESMLAEHLDSIDERVSRNPRNPRNNRNSQTSLGDRVGGLLGGGSRNNALNLFGKSIGALINLGSKLGSVFKTVFNNFKRGFTEASESAGILQKIGAGFGNNIASGAAAIAESGPAAVVAVAGIAAAMGVLVSVAGALLAILTAIAATILSALTGAILVAVGALGALGVAVGLAAVAFTSLDDEQKKALKADFQPLKAELTGLGQLMLTQLIPYFGTWADNLKIALYQLAPLASVFGDALGRAGSILSASLSGPGFALFTQQLGVFLPSIVTRLSTALGGFLNGLAATFAALLPQVNRFAGYLSDVGTRFANFASSAKGQNQIKDFVDRAITSLISLSNFVGQVAGFISDLLFNPTAQNAGNSIFDGLTAKFSEFRDQLAGAIADGSFEKWFNDGIKFGKTFVDVVGSIFDVIKAIYSSGLLEALGNAFTAIADGIRLVADVAGPMVDFLGYVLPKALAIALAPVYALIAGVVALKESLDFLTGGTFDMSNITDQLNTVVNMWNGSLNAPGALPTAGVKPQYDAPIGPGLDSSGDTTLNTAPSVPSLSDLLASGNTALANTSVDAGGYKTKPKKPEYKNPYLDYANSLIKNGPKIAAQIRNAILNVNKQIKGAVEDATKANSGDDVASSFSGIVDSIKTGAKTGINTAQQALNTAAQSLANADSAKAAKKALKGVKSAQKDLAAALDNQVKINAAAKILNNQKVVTESNVQSLLNGVFTQNATLADYAEARGRLADKLTEANQKLADAISLRDSYNKQVADSIRSFGSILSAQAKTINGVAQALTYGDITSNLQDRLDQITKFNADLQILLAQGLSNAAYQQIVDGGVEQGGAYAAALVQGGVGAVQQVNGLVQQISDVADGLGAQASSRLYQAGVDAAQGLVDGLTSLSAQLDSAATALGNTIAQAVKTALGIASPSRVMIESMGYVGDGLVVGMDRQHRRVSDAASRLSDNVAISPSLAAAYAEGRVPPAVSGNQGTGNDPRFRDLIIHTPTENPRAVAREVLNEVTGRL